MSVRASLYFITENTINDNVISVIEVFSGRIAPLEMIRNTVIMIIVNGID